MKEIAANCSLCSLACPLIFTGLERSPIFTGQALLAVEWDSRPDSKFGGSLCARGNALAEFVSHPKRLNYPFILGERTTIDAAVKEVAKNIKAAKDESGGSSIGVLIGENLTNEEAKLALKFAHEVLETENIALFAPDDAPVIRGYFQYDVSGIKSGTSKPEGKNEVAVLIGDPFSEHPCIAKDILKTKNAARGNEVIVISPEVNHAAWFANNHLLCRPGGEAAVIAGLAKSIAGRTKTTLPSELKKVMEGIGWDEIERVGGVEREAIAQAASSMARAAKGRLFISNIFGRIGSPALTTTFAEVAVRSCPGEWEFTPQMVLQNTLGIYKALGMNKGAPTIEKILGESVKAVILLGLDIFSAFPASVVENGLRAKNFMATTQLFWNQTAERANVVIPAVNLIEKRGTVSVSFDEDLVRDDVISPYAGAITDEEFLVKLSKELGKELGAVENGKADVQRSGSCEGIDREWADYIKVIEPLFTADSVLLPWSEAVHVGDGSLSRHFNWSSITCPEPELMVSEELAGSLKIDDGDFVTVSTSSEEVELKAKRTGKLKGNMAAATIHFPSVRKLFPWNFDPENGELVLLPVPVSLSKKEKK